MACLGHEGSVRECLNPDPPSAGLHKGFVLQQYLLKAQLVLSATLLTWPLMRSSHVEFFPVPEEIQHTDEEIQLLKNGEMFLRLEVVA